MRLDGLMAMRTGITRNPGVGEVEAVDGFHERSVFLEDLTLLPDGDVPEIGLRDEKELVDADR